MGFFKSGGGGGNFFSKFFAAAKASQKAGAKPPLPGIADPPSAPVVDAVVPGEGSTGQNSARAAVARNLRKKRATAGLGATSAGANSAPGQIASRLLG